MKQPILFGGLLAVALVGAYTTWTAEEVEERKATDVLVYRADADAVTSVTWSDEDHTVRMTRPKDASGAYVWIEQTDRKKVVPPTPEGAEVPEGAEAPPAPEPVIEETTTRFSGNEQAVEAWTSFAPLYALRELALGADADLASYGLDEPSSTLVVDVGGKSVTIEVGGESYGTRDRYARAEGKLYLLDDGLVRPLQFAKSRLVERRLHPFEEKDILQVAVRRGADARTFVQKNADDRTKSFWADAAVADKKDAEAGAWLGKLFRLRVKSYVDEADAPAAREAVFAFEVKGRDGAWSVEVTKAEVDGEPTYYASSSFTRGLVDLTRSLAEEAVADLDPLFDGVTPEADEDEGAEPEPAEPAEPAEGELDEELMPRPTPPR